MSVIIETIITCDGDSDNCEGNDWSADSRHFNASEQRKMAKDQLGWHHTGGKDYCATCWAYRKQMKKLQ